MYAQHPATALLGPCTHNTQRPALFGEHICQNRGTSYGLPFVPLKNQSTFVSVVYRRRAEKWGTGCGRCRIPAPDIDAVISKALREYLARSNVAAAPASSADPPSIRAMDARIEVCNSHLAVWLMPSRGRRRDHSSSCPERRKLRAVDPLEGRPARWHCHFSDASGLLPFERST
jgi:hypothetical protein